ncbi:MAG: LysR family transcriptional regulator [Erythrobacter sp.]
MRDLRSLRHFEAVYRFTSFSAAAEELGLTHSALTKSIKLLEDSWGVQLFHRTTRTVAPTEAANRLYPKAVELLAFAEDVQRSVKSGAHEMRVVCGPGILDNLIHPAILRYAERFPETRLVVSTMPPHLAAAELVQRRAHLLLYHRASIAGMPHVERMRVSDIADEPYWMLFRNGHVEAQASDDLASSAELDWALAGFDHLFERSLSEDVRRMLREKGVPRYRVMSQAACVELARNSNIVTAAPESAARGILSQGGLEGRPHPGGFRFSVSAAVLHDAAHEPTVAHFIECLRAND